MDTITEEQLAAAQVALEEEFVSYVKTRAGSHPKFSEWKTALREHNRAEADRLLAIILATSTDPP